MMNAVAAGLEKQEQLDLAAYYAAQRAEGARGSRRGEQRSVPSRPARSRPQEEIRRCSAPCATWASLPDERGPEGGRPTYPNTSSAAESLQDRNAKPTMPEPCRASRRRCPTKTSRIGALRRGVCDRCQRPSQPSTRRAGTGRLFSGLGRLVGVASLPGGVAAGRERSVPKGCGPSAGPWCPYHLPNCSLHMQLVHVT